MSFSKDNQLESHNQMLIVENRRLRETIAQLQAENEQSRRGVTTENKTSVHANGTIAANADHFEDRTQLIRLIEQLTIELEQLRKQHGMVYGYKYII